MSTEAAAAAAGGGCCGAAAIPAAAPELYARDAMIAWFRSEFAAANAIIDVLCGHLAEIGCGGGASGYEAVFAAIHRRRANWIPVLHMQTYFSVAEIAAELRRVAASRAAAAAAVAAEEEESAVAEEAEMKGSPKEEKVVEGKEEGDGGVNGVRGPVTDEPEEEDSSGDSSDRKGFEEENGADEGKNKKNLKL